MATATQLARYKDRTFVRAIAFSGDGAFLATGGDDKTVQVRQLATGQLTSLSGAAQAIVDVAFSPNGAWVAAGSADQTVRVSNVPDSGSQEAVAYRLMEEVKGPYIEPAAP